TSPPHALLVKTTPPPAESKSLEVRRPSDRDQDFVAPTLPAPPASTDDDHLRARLLLHPFDLCTQAKRDALALENPSQQLSGFFVLARQQTLPAVDQAHLAAKPMKSLGQLASDGPTADHRQAPRGLGQRKDRLVGEVTGLREAGNGQSGGAGSGGDHRLEKTEPLLTDLNRLRSDELRVSQEDVHAQASEPLRRVMFRNPSAHAAHPLRRGGEVDKEGTLDSSSKPRAVIDVARRKRRAQNTFGGN